MTQSQIDPTRERILDEAERLFAQKGFAGVSVREITAAAACNLAAVNYHFGNKENLYLEVFRSRWANRASRLRAFFEEILASKKKPDLKDIFSALAGAFLNGPLSDEEFLYHAQLMQREMVNPTQAFEEVGVQVMGPFFKDLIEKLRPHLPRNTDDETLMLKVLSIFAMILYFNFARLAVTRLTGRSYDTAFKEQLMRHITDFSFKGFDGPIAEKAK